MKRPLRLLGLLLGILLVVAGGVAGYLWFYRWAPLRHLCDPAWRDAHSQRAAWAEEQKHYWRTNDSPDLVSRSDTIGCYGDKAWAAWLIENIEKDEAFDFCECTVGVLADMTNQDLNDAADWLAWYRNHKAETQEEWIQQGFAKYGVKVHLPPSAEDTEALLSLLGDREKNAEDVYKVPGSVRYNAFRWLRDSGFDVEEYVQSHQNWRSSELVAFGIYRYARLSGVFPGNDGLGQLAFGAKPTSHCRVAPIADTATKATANIIVFGSLSLGLVTIFFSIRRKRFTVADQKIEGIRDRCSEQVSARETT